MKRTLISIAALCTLFACNQPKNGDTHSQNLPQTFEQDFYIGAALSDAVVKNKDPKVQSLVQTEFNSIVAENCMKSGPIQPKEGEFFWEEADRFMDYGEKHNMHIVGHCLVWHSQAPEWMFTDDEGNDVTRDVLIQRMKDHIYAVVGRYKGRVDGWDVVNEAIENDKMRESKYYKIIGPEFIDLAFQFANEVDPEAELYYNDYSLNIAAKRNRVCELVKHLQSKGIRIDAVGMQAHYGFDIDMKEVDESIKAFAKLGIKVMLTEIDITVIPFPSEQMTAEVSTSFEYQKEFNPYPDALPEEIETQLAAKYVELFDVLINNSETVTRATFWGVNDGYSWRNGWPIPGRTDYPLLFNRENNPKKAYYEVMKLKTKK